MEELISSTLIGGVASIITSFIFWWLTFRLSLTNVMFSDCIAVSKSKGSDQDQKRCIFRVQNTGIRDLTEVDFTVVCSIFQLENGHHRRNNIYLSCASETIPFLEGRRTQRADHLLHVRKMRIRISEQACEDIARITTKPQVVEKAQARTLTLGDLLEAFSGDDYLKLRVYCYGYDSVTGARKAFLSPEYTSESIIEGEFESIVAKRDFYLKHPRALKADFSKLMDA